jgi:hypothetical protein
MRVEQRIGRCDRLGQQSQKVHVGNLASTGTIEARILSRLYQRLHVFERALGDMELILGPEIAEFEREVFTLGLSPSQQEERLDRVAEAIARIEQQRESITAASDLFIAGRQLIESEQQEIKDAESRFLSPSEIGDFVSATLEKHFAGSIKTLAEQGLYEIVRTKDIREALRSLHRAYATSHYARMETQRFGKKLDEGRIRVSFIGDDGQAEYVHVRHPLVLLARWLSREPLPEIPYCRSVIAGRQDIHRILLWAVGSLEGYTNRAELIAVVVDCLTQEASVISVEEAQALVRSLLPVEGNAALMDNIDELMAEGERALSRQFEDGKRAFNGRNSLLIDKASQAVRSHAERKLKWLGRQLSRNDLKDNIRNLYRGWSQRLQAETQAKLEEIEQKGRVKSSLQVVGMVVILPDVKHQAGDSTPPQ